MKLQEAQNSEQGQTLITKNVVGRQRKIESKKRRGQQRMKWLGTITNSMDVNLSKLWEIVEYRGAWHAAVHGVTKSWT